MSIGSLGIKTHAVGLAPSIEAIARSVNRRGIVVRVRASDFTQPLGKMSASASEFTKSLEASNARVIAFGASAVIIGSVTTSFAQLVIQAVKVEKILADINAVLGASVETLQKFGDGLFNVARNTSQSLEIAAEAALEFSRQGLNMEETLKRTNDALILTRLTGLAAADSVKGLTAAVNGFADAGLNTTEIINKLAAVDVKFAVSAEDLINALARAGAVAQDAGVNFDQLIGAVTSAQQITARGGAVIGNSFKTIFTRLQRSSTLDRLQELGIAVKDLRGETLPALTVLKQLAQSYDTLGDSTKAAIAEQVGGVFQINILKAALKDLSKENSLYSQATMTSSEATNEAYQKNAMLQKTLSSISTQTLTTVRELTANLGELSIAPALKDFLDTFNSAMKGISDLLGAEKGESIGSDFAQGLVRAVGSVLTGPGFFGLVLIFGKLFSSALKFAKNSVKDLLQIKTIKDQELGIQESIVNAMLRNVELSEQLVKLDGNQVKQEELVLAVLRQQTKEIEQQRQIAQNIAPALRRAGVQPNLIVTGNKSQKTQNSASGFVPNYSKQPTPIEEIKEKAGAKEGGYVAGKVSTMSIPKMGRVVYNDNETVKRFKGMDQPAIMPPKNSKAGKRYEKEFAGKHGFDPYASYGLIPNFAIEATRVPGTNILNLPRAKMITETTQTDNKANPVKGWKTLEARLDNIVKSAPSYRDEFEALKKLGVDVLRRKMYFSSQKSSIKNEMRAISRDRKNLSKSKGFAKRNQNNITGSRFEGALFKGSLKQKGYYPSWTGAYTKDGIQKGKGDQNFKVDFFAPGRKPIESKYGKYTPPNLIAKSIRLYSDQYIEKFLSKHGSSGLAENMGNKKLQDSAQMLTSLGYKDVGPKEVLRAGLSGGLIPNFAKKITWDIDKKKGSYGLSSDYMGLSGFANYLDQMSKAHPEMVSPKAAQTFLQRMQSQYSRDRKSTNKNNPIGFGAKGAKHYSAMAGVSSSKRTVSTNNLFIKDINKHIQHYNKHGIFAVDKINSYDSLLSEGYIPNFANKVYDRDKIPSGLAGDILNEILSNRKKKNLLLGPSGAGKTTMAARYGTFIQNLEDAEAASSYTILSGAAKTKKGGVSPALRNIINAVNQSGGTVSYLSASDKVLDERRNQRIAQPLKGDLRSTNQLMGTKYAPKNQPDFIKNVQKLSAKFKNVQASNGFIPNFESKNWQNEKSSGTIDNQLKEAKDRAEAVEDKKGSKNHSHYNRGFIPNFFRSFLKTKKGTINATHAYYLKNGKVFKPQPGQSPKSKELRGKTANLAPNKKTIDFDTLAEATVNSSNITRRVRSSGVAISFNTKPGNAYEKAIQASYVIKGWTGVGPANLDFTNTKWAKRNMPTANKLKTPIGGGPKNLNKYWRYADAHFGSGHGARPILEKLIRSKLVNKKMIEGAMASGLLDLTASRKTSKFAEIIGSGGENLGYTSSKIFKPLQSNQGVNKETFGNFEGTFKEPSGFNSSNPDGAFAIKFPKDHFTHLNKPKNDSPLPQEHAIGYIPNFSVWNPLTKDTKAIAKQGGLADSKFGLAKIIQSSPFADLLREHKHWNNFPKKHKKRLNLWLRSQGYTHRALQGWGLLSKHSKSIASGVGDLAAHHGHIPNFANPLGDAISREKEALRERGSAADIYIDQDDRLKNPKNPAGLLVANTRDEPKSGSQGVNRAISMGMDPKTHGASGGVVPNYSFAAMTAGGKAAYNTPSSIPVSPKVNEQLKNTGDASNDLMMKMMGLTTVTYALQGAMGEVTEESNGFQKSMGVLNAAIMGLSQAAMVSMIAPKGKLKEGLTQFNEARKKPATPVEGSGAKGKIKASAGKAGAMLKGVGGMAMGALGPLGMAITLLIPVITALKDHFGLFMSATERASKSLESLEKGLAAIEQASQAAANMQQNQAKLYELEAIGAKRSIAQEKEYIMLQGEEMKNQRTLDEGINKVVKSFTKQDASLGDSDRIQRLLSGTYKDQIKILNEMELSQRRLINLASNVKMSVESIDKAGGSNNFFSIASLDKLTPDLKNVGVDMAAALNFDFKSMDDSSVAKLTGQINNLSNSFSDAADDIDEVPLDRLKDIVRTAASSRGGDVYEDEINRIALELRNAIVSTSSSLDSGGESVQRQRKGVDIALNSILDFVKLRVSSSSEPQANELNLKALTFFSEQGQQYLQSQTFLMKRQVELQEKQLSISQKTLNLANKQAGFEEIDIPSFFKLISKDEEIDRKTTLSNRDVDIRASTDKSKIQLQSESKATEVAMKLFEPDDFNKGLFGDLGFQETHLRKLDDIIKAIKGEGSSGVESDSPQESGSPQLTEVQQEKLKKAEDSRSAIVNDKWSLQALLSGYGISAKQRGEIGLSKVTEPTKKSFNKLDVNAFTKPGFYESPWGSLTDKGKSIAKKSRDQVNSTIDNNAKLLEPLLTGEGGMSKEEFEKAIKELKTAYEEGSINKEKYEPSTILTKPLKNIKSASSIEDAMRGKVNTEARVEERNTKTDQRLAEDKAAVQEIARDAQKTRNDWVNKQADFAKNQPKQAEELKERGLVGGNQPNVQSFLNFDASQFNPSSLEGISGIPSDFKFDTNTIQDTIQTFKAFQDKIKNLLKDPERRFEYTDKDGNKQSMQAVTKEEFSAESNRMLSGKSPEESAAIIAASIQSGLISAKSKETKETSFELQKTSIEAKDETTNVDKKAALDKKSNDLQAMIQKFQAKTVDGYRIAVKALVDFEAKNGPLRGNLLKAQKDELQGRMLNEGLRNAMLDMELKNSEELQALGMIYAASRAAAESSLTEQLNKNITDKENLKAANDSRDATEKGLRATRDSMEMDREKQRATLIEVQNKLKLSDLTEQLAADVKQESDLKIGQLQLDSKTLDAKRKLYENTEALQREVALQLEIQTKTKDIALQELRTSISEKGKIIEDPESPGYGMTTYQFNAQNRSETAISQRDDEINERRADQSFYTKQGNSLRGAEMKLQVRQLQKQQNIEEGKGGLFSDTVAVKIAETNVELERFGETLANTTFDSVTAGFKELTQTMFDGTKSMNDAMYGFFGGILQAISEKFLDRAVKQMTSGIFDLLGFDEKYNGGLIRGYASGGHTQQSPAMLTAGEYVVRKKVVDRLGVSSLDKMNKTGKVDDSLQDLYSKPNDDSVDISTTGSANIPGIQRFNEGGRLNSVISKITSPMVKFFNSGGWNNPFSANADDSGVMKVAKGAGYVGGSSLASYEEFKKQQAQDTGPVAPKAPGSTRLNTGSSLDIDPSSGMMSARFRKTDQYSQQYGQYLLDKYEHNIKQKNERTMARANIGQSILSNVGGTLASMGISETVTAFKGLKTATGGFTQFSNAAAQENFAKYWKENDMVEADGDSLMLKGHGMKNPMELDKKEIKEAKKYGGYVPTMNEVKQLQKEVEAMKKHTNLMGDISKNSGESYSLPQDSNLERIKQIQTTKRSGGGRVFGPSGRDQVGPVMLDKGEYVIRASSVNSIEKQYPGFFDRINAMKFNQGGSVGEAKKTQETASPSGGNVTVNVNVSSGGQGSAEGGGGSDQAFASKIKEAVVGVISQEQRVGGTLNGK